MLPNAFVAILLILYCLLLCVRSGASLVLVQLLLAQLTLVDQQRHGEAVLEEIFEILSVASEPAGRLIVGSLEDIVDITLHDRIIVKIL